MSSRRQRKTHLWPNRARTLNERARMHRVEGHLTAADLRNIVARDGSRCVYCDRALDYSVAGNGDEKSASFDHVVRLVDGGSHSYENVVCACRGCNQRNANKSLEDPEGAAIERLRKYLARRAA